jgi:hypothetical protein
MVEIAALLCFVAGTSVARERGRGFVVRTALRRLAFLAAVTGMAALAGCADGNGDPGAVPLASGQSCGSIQEELNRLLRTGVQSKVEAASAGRKLSPAAKADADRYNALLNQYLGARCHV